MKKRKKIFVTREERARWDANQRRLAERIAYHKAKLAEERGERA